MKDKSPNLVKKMVRFTLTEIAPEFGPSERKIIETWGNFILQASDATADEMASETLKIVFDELGNFFKGVQAAEEENKNLKAEMGVKHIEIENLKVELDSTNLFLQQAKDEIDRLAEELKVTKERLKAMDELATSLLFEKSTQTGRTTEKIVWPTTGTKRFPPSSWPEPNLGNPYPITF